MPIVPDKFPPRKQETFLRGASLLLLASRSQTIRGNTTAEVSKTFGNFSPSVSKPSLRVKSGKGKTAMTNQLQKPFISLQEQLKTIK
jgi:hypothetical protein